MYKRIRIEETTTEDLMNKFKKSLEFVERVERCRGRVRHYHRVLLYIR